MAELRLKHITFTGVDVNTDITRLEELTAKYPFAEFGVLTSYHWNENGNRFPDPKIIEKIRLPKNNLSLHVCGRAAHDAAIGRWEKLDDLIFGNLHLFGRVQLNISTRKDNPHHCNVPLVIGQEVILQQKDIMNTEFFQNTIEFWNQPSYKWSMLLDASGGTGKDTEIRLFSSKQKVGYAGGINPENVADKLRFLLGNVSMGEFWIDMESGVRTEDWFDLDKVEKILKSCQVVLGETKE